MYNNLATFWQRFAARMIDIVLISLIITPLNVLLTQKLVYNLTLGGVIGAIITATYFTIMTRLFGQTVGKIMLKIRVMEDDDTRISWLNSIYRATIGDYLNSLLNIGYLMVLGNKRKTFADMLCDTKVIDLRLPYYPQFQEPVINPEEELLE